MTIIHKQIHVLLVEIVLSYLAIEGKHQTEVPQQTLENTTVYD
jgi:hypothetical protein